MRNIILDTNTFVAAGFKRNGAAAHILQMVRDGELTLVWNEATRAETRMVMRKIPPVSWEAVADLFQPENEFTGETRPEDCGFVPDPDDRKFAALAEATNATLITMDDDLLGNRHLAGAWILRPHEFLEELD